LGPLALRLLERYLAHFWCLISILVLPTTHLPDPLYNLCEIAITIATLARDLHDLSSDDLVAVTLVFLEP